MSPEFLFWLLIKKLETEIDEAGWIDIQKLSSICLSQYSRTLDKNFINSLVDFKMIEISDDNQKIRIVHNAPLNYTVVNNVRTFNKIKDLPIYHATFKSYLEKILDFGLQPLSKGYVYLSQNENQLKKNANVWIELDYDKWIADGNEIFISDEQIILIDKVIDSKYFKNVIFYSKIALPSF